jgi:hypothetical protein
VVAPLSSWVPSFLAADARGDVDSLSSLEQLYGVDAVTLAEANGVAPSPGRKKDCAWGRRVDAWVLAASKDRPDAPRGVRRPYDPRAPWTCAPGEGFVSFVAGQEVRLPPGGPRKPALLPQRAVTKSSSSSSLWPWVIGGAASLAAGAGVAVAVARHRKAGAR